MQYFIAILVIFFIYVIIDNKIKEKKELKIILQELQQEEDEIKKFFLEIYSDIYQANYTINTFLSERKKYITFSELQLLKNKYSYLFSEKLLTIDFEKIDLTTEELENIEDFKLFMKNPELLRKKANDKFITFELIATQSLLNDIDNGKSLDKSQRDAILRDEDNSLVIAGAGCGKTTTIIGKVEYLTKHLKVNPKDLLLISFTNKSAKDLKNKIKIPDIDIKTFHKLGKDIILKTEQAIPSTYDQSSSFFLEKEFNKNLANDKYLNLVVTYFTNYIRIKKNEFDFTNQAEHIQHLKDQNYRPYKQIEIHKNNKITYLREIVKSQQECEIANFLLFNGIEYRYEEPYEIDTKSIDYKQYAPDFSLYQDNKRFYLEHYGIDEEGNVPNFFANEKTTIEEAKIKYNNSIEWKRELHLSNATTCLETFSYEFQNGTIFKKLEKTLEEHGFILRKLSNQEKWSLINLSATDEVKSLINLFNTFLNLFKSNNYTIEHLKNELELMSGFNKERTRCFLKIFYPLYIAYEKMLKRKEQIDFSDMINKATSYINSGQYISNYKYVIIDEFQDISKGRYELLKALRKQNPSIKIFAVGDDWQSIYKFTGSDISLFNNFQNYFGYTNETKIETTYRFGFPMIDVSGKFIMRNPFQIKKKLRNANQNIKTTYKVYYTDSVANDDTMAFINAVDDLIEEIISRNKETLDEIGYDVAEKLIKSYTFTILGRYNNDINRLLVDNDKIIRDGDKILFKIPSTKNYIELRFLTVHRAKGLESDYVIILNCNSGKMGFPSEMSDDEVLLMLLGESESFPNSEERRLFYVALTRAKIKTALISNLTYSSKFIQELIVKEGNNRLCPRCKSGKLILKTGFSDKNNAYWGFYSCSNFNTYNCRYKSDWLSDNKLKELRNNE